MAVSALSRVALATLLILAALATAAPLAGMYGEMATALGVHVAVPLLVLGAWAVRRGRKIDGVLAVLGLAGLLSTCARAPAPGSTAPGAIDVIVVNAYEGNPVPAADIDAALGDADVAVLIEPRAGLASVLAEGRAVAVRRTVGSKFDIVALVRSPDLVETATVHRFDGAQSVTGELVLRTSDGRVSLTFVHVPAPTTRAQQAERDRLQTALGDLLTSRAAPVVVAGDFNASPTSPLLSAIASRADLRLFTGRPTWPISWGPFGVAIDHVLAGPGAAVSAPQPFVLPGSDHLGWRFSISPRRRGT